MLRSLPILEEMRGKKKKKANEYKRRREWKLEE